MCYPLLDKLVRSDEPDVADGVAWATCSEGDQLGGTTYGQAYRPPIVTGRNIYN